MTKKNNDCPALLLELLLVVVDDGGDCASCVVVVGLAGDPIRCSFSLMVVCGDSPLPPRSTAAVIFYNGRLDNIEYSTETTATKNKANLLQY